MKIYDFDADKFGRFLKYKTKDITQKKVAESVNMSQSKISRLIYTKDSVLSVRDFLRLCEFMEVEPDLFFYEVR